MLSKNRVKFLKSLQIKKFRREHQQFIVEGAKSVLEFLSSDFEVDFLVSTEEFRQANHRYVAAVKEWVTADAGELAALGTFQTNDGALAVVNMKAARSVSTALEGWIIALDEVKDPGNLGTIIRIADWYGIKTLVCSPGTADCYNPKVISASMGSFTRVDVHYLELGPYLKELNVPVFAAMLEGKDIHTIKAVSSGVLLMGSESHGVSESLLSGKVQKVTIPRIGQAESLNVAVATAIIMDNLISR